MIIEMTHFHSKQVLPSEHIITQLPYQVTLLLLRRILQINGIDNLESLLKAVPPLSKYVLLLTDHPENPYKLFPVRTVQAVVIASLIPCSRYEIAFRLQDVIVVSSFLYIEDSSTKHACDVLKRAFFGANGFAAMRSSFVFAQVFDPHSHGTSFLLCSVKSPYRFYYTKTAPKGWLHFKTDSKYALCEAGQIVRRQPRSPSTIGSLVKRALLSLPSTEPRPAKITTLSVSSNSNGFIHLEKLRSVTTVKITSFSGCGLCRNHILDVCRGPLLRFRTPKVNSLFITYTGCVPPRFDWQSYEIAWKNDPPNAVFVLLNYDWSKMNPFGAPACRNLFDFAGPTHRDLSRESQMPFVKRFHTVLLLGVPANALTIMDLSNVRTLVWERWIDSAPPPQSENLFLCLPNLQQLTLARVVRSQWGFQFASHVWFEAPQLRDICLTALPHSNEAWQISSLFAYQQRFTQEHEIELLLSGNDSGLPNPAEAEQLAVDASNLSYLAADLKNLMITDYVPLFLIEPKDVVFKSLQRLSVDISELQTILVGSKRRITLEMPIELFPRLETVSLTLSLATQRAYTTLIQSVVLTLPHTIREISVAQFLASALRELTVNGRQLLNPEEIELLSLPYALKGDTKYMCIGWWRNTKDEPFSIQPTAQELYIRRYLRTHTLLGV